MEPWELKLLAVAEEIGSLPPGPTATSRLAAGVLYGLLAVLETRDVALITDYALTVGAFNLKVAAWKCRRDEKGADHDGRQT